MSRKFTVVLLASLISISAVLPASAKPKTAIKNTAGGFDVPIGAVLPYFGKKLPTEPTPLGKNMWNWASRELRVSWASQPNADSDLDTFPAEAGPDFAGQPLPNIAEGNLLGGAKEADVIGQAISPQENVEISVGPGKLHTVANLATTNPMVNPKGIKYPNSLYFSQLEFVKDGAAQPVDSPPVDMWLVNEYSPAPGDLNPERFGLKHTMSVATVPGKAFEHRAKALVRLVELEKKDIAAPGNVEGTLTLKRSQFSPGYVPVRYIVRVR